MQQHFEDLLLLTVYPNLEDSTKVPYTVENHLIALLVPSNLLQQRVLVSDLVKGSSFQLGWRGIWNRTLPQERTYNWNTNNQSEGQLLDWVINIMKKCWFLNRRKIVLVCMYRKKVSIFWVRIVAYLPQSAKMIFYGNIL